MANNMTPQEFIAKWKKAQLSERSAAQQHFLDLLSRGPLEIWQNAAAQSAHSGTICKPRF